MRPRVTSSAKATFAAVPQSVVVVHLIAFFRLAGMQEPLRPSKTLDDVHAAAVHIRRAATARCMPGLLAGLHPVWHGRMAPSL
jgi:hypothetical protein